MTERLSTSGPADARLGAPADGARSLLHRRRRGARARSHDRAAGALVLAAVREVLGKKGAAASGRRARSEASASARARRTPPWNRIGASAVPAHRPQLRRSRRRLGRPHRRRAQRARRAGGPPILMTTAPVPTVRPDVEVHHVAVPERFWNFSELPTLRVELRVRRGDAARRRRSPDFVRLPALQPEQLRGPAARASPQRAVRPRVQRIGDLDEPPLGAPAEVRGHRLADRAAQPQRAPI